MRKIDFRSFKNYLQINICPDMKFLYMGRQEILAKNFLPCVEIITFCVVCSTSYLLYILDMDNWKKIERSPI